MTSEMPETMPDRNPEVEVAEFGHEFVIFDARCSEVHRLSDFAAVVFDACDGTTASRTLISEVTDAVGVDERTASDATMSTLAHLAGIGAIVGTFVTERPP